MVSLTDAEPMPNQEMVIGRLGASGYFTKINLSKGYWQIPIKKEHMYLTAFQTEMGLRQFRVMPFGLNKYGAVFCRMVRELLQGLPNVESYIYDLTIHTLDWEGHLDAVRRVLERFTNCTSDEVRSRIQWDKVVRASGRKRCVETTRRESMQNPGGLKTQNKEGPKIILRSRGILQEVPRSICREG